MKLSLSIHQSKYNISYLNSFAILEKYELAIMNPVIIEPKQSNRYSSGS